MADPSPFPREHGAWAMLLQPFLGAMLVYQQLTWPLLPALASVLLVFLIRGPLIVLARQRWVWQVAKPETAAARRNLIAECLLLAVSGAAIAFAWPWRIVAILAAGAALLTALAVVITIRGRQRAIWFQALSAAGLASSGFAVCVSLQRTIPLWAWWFCGLHAAHYLAAILVVHARLDARVAARHDQPGPTPAAAIWLATAFVVAGMALVIDHRYWYGAALLLSGIVHMGNLRGLSNPKSLAIPLTRIGVRAMVLSIVVTLLLVAGSSSTAFAPDFTIQTASGCGLFVGQVVNLRRVVNPPGRQ